MAMIEVLRSGVNTWECDQMGHMNVRFYVAKMMEGLAELGRQCLAKARYTALVVTGPS